MHYLIPSIAQERDMGSFYEGFFLNAYMSKTGRIWHNL